MTDYKKRMQAYAAICLGSVGIERATPGGLAGPLMLSPVRKHGRREWSSAACRRTPLVFQEAWVETRACQNGQPPCPEW
jgi:hypothetical protein